MKSGESMSYHLHNHREEVWTVVSGQGIVTMDGKEQKVTTGDVIKIPVGTKHTVKAVTSLEIIEVQVGEEISCHDKVKN